ncbi:MAG: hypothetical protein ACF8SC_09595 [Phycisphaerales bacterium JB037]
MSKEDQRAELIGFLESLASRHEAYHAHKERMAYLPAGVFALAATGAAGASGFPYFHPVFPTWLSALTHTAFILGLCGMFWYFSKRQLDLKFGSQYRSEGIDMALGRLVCQDFDPEWIKPMESRLGESSSGTAVYPKLYIDCRDLAQKQSNRPIWQDRILMALYALPTMGVAIRIWAHYFSL